MSWRSLLGFSALFVLCLAMSNGQAFNFLCFCCASALLLVPFIITKFAKPSTDEKQLQLFQAQIQELYKEQQKQSVLRKTDLSELRTAIKNATATTSGRSSQ